MEGAVETFRSETPPDGFDLARLATWPRAGRLEWVTGRLLYSAVR